MKPNFSFTPIFVVVMLMSLLAALPVLSANSVDNNAELELIRHLNQPWIGDLDGMRERRYVRVLVTYSRTNFYLDGAETKGLTAETFKAFEKWVNKRLGTRKHPIHVAFIPVRRDELLSALRSGIGDIATGGLSITAERELDVDFTEPWVSDVREVVVAGPDSPALTRLEDLSGQSVAVRRSSSYRESLTALNLRLAAMGREPARIIDVDENLESEDIMEMVGAGVLPLTVVDQYRADLWAGVLPGVRVRGDLTVAEGQRIAWAVRKESPLLRGLLNEFVRHYKSTRDFSYIGRKYFAKAGYLRNPAASEDRRRFNGAVQFFRKYGSRYDLDYLLLAAQGYQESRLDQGARSPRGAVGVMQLLPSTAASAPINLPNIKDLETNIHAGVKYHHHITNTYFRDPALTPVNRMLFAFAAYNAGPGNVAKMRRLAATMGLDPNQWFANVEVAAGKVTGQETIRYVGNIYKYYVAYRMMLDRAEEHSRSKRSFLSQ